MLRLICIISCSRSTTVDADSWQQSATNWKPTRHHCNAFDGDMPRQGRLLCICMCLDELRVYNWSAPSLERRSTVDPSEQFFYIWSEKFVHIYLRRNMLAKRRNCLHCRLHLLWPKSCSDGKYGNFPLVWNIPRCSSTRQSRCLCSACLLSVCLSASYFDGRTLLSFGVEQSSHHLIAIQKWLMQIRQTNKSMSIHFHGARRNAANELSVEFGHGRRFRARRFVGKAHNETFVCQTKWIDAIPSMVCCRRDLHANTLCIWWNTEELTATQ